MNELLLIDLLLTLSVDLLLDLKENSVAFRLVLAFLGYFASHLESFSKLLSEDL
jgi:hypothetical protein